MGDRTREKEIDRIAVKWVPTASLIPYARNARLHSSAQIAKIGASIKEFGWTNPILTDGDNGVIAGHGRLAAAQLLKIENVPTIELSHLSETQKRAYILADNRLALDATWDEEMLGLELQDLKAEEFDLELIGFTLDEVTADGEIDRESEDRAGSSPWERVGDGADGVIFHVGDLVMKIDATLYERIKSAIGESDAREWWMGKLNEICDP